MTPEQLKASILQYAIQGKLVEQRLGERTATELYHQIQNEKQRLIKEGKIKKEKPLAEITEDEIPFDIPETWKWVRLADICSQVSDGTHKTPSYTTEGIPFVSVKDISSGYLDFSNTKFISLEEHNQLIARCKPEDRDILICRIGTLGKAIKIETKNEFSIFVSLGLIKPVDKLLSDYIVMTINSGYGFSWIQKVKVGGGTHTFKINLDDLRSFPIPLPPLEEQHRIVAKIKECLPYVDRYAEAYEKLEQFNAKFPEDMRKSILQYAIQGKLVEQRPEEGTAEELYQQIQEERRLLPKPKGLSAICEKDVLFDIPNTWKWVRLGEIATVIRGLTFSKSTKDELEGTSLVFRGGNIDSKTEKINYEDNIYVDTSIIKEEQFIKKGDTLIVSSSGTKSSIGKSCYINENLTNISFGGFMMVVRPSEKVNAEYISIQIKLYRQKIIAQTAGYIGNITNPILNNIMIPLPPYEEQNRIIDKIHMMLPYCDELINK